MRSVRLLAILILAGTAFASGTSAASTLGRAKRGWTKVHLTQATGGSGPFPAALLEKRGGELLVVGHSYAIGYLPAAGIAALQADARKEGITVAPRDDFDVLTVPSTARVDVREGIGDGVPQDGRVQSYPGNKPGLFLIQFIAPARAEWVTELVSMGWKMARYIPANGYMIAGGPELVGRTRQLPYIQFLDFFHPYQKAKQLVRDGVSRDLVFELPGAGIDTTEAIDAIRAAAENGVQVHRGDEDTLVYARLPHGKAEALLQHPLVISVSPHSYGGLSDERQAMSLTSNLNTAGSAPTNPTGYTTWLSGRCSTCSSMSAAEWRIGLADTGLDNGLNLGGHPDLASRKYIGARVYNGTGHDTCTAGNLDCDRYGHGTVVAGLMVGNAATGRTDNLGFYWGMGVVPWAGVFSTKIFTASTNADLSRLFEFTRDAANNDVTIQNHSFNEYYAEPEQSGLYSALARQYDIAVRDADGALSANRKPLLIAVAAGNNTQDLRTNRFRVLGGGTAKNVLSMGGAENHRPGVTGCIAPGDDFRNIMQSSRTGTLLPNYIKPDLVAPSAPVSAANSSEITTNTSYCIDNLHPDYLYNGDSGTSFAAPVGAGAALIVKRYLGTTPGATSPALAKAMLIAGAKSIRGGIDKTTNPDTTIGSFPNGQQGFGRISLDDIITGSTPPVWYDQSTVRTFTPDNSPFRIRLRVRDASKPVKVAVVWTDAPGTAYVSNPLVNDLDLELYRSSTPFYRLNGNHLQVTDTNKGEESIPVSIYDGTSGRDRTNNVEVVRAFLTSNEEFDVQVNGYFIWGDTDGTSSTWEQDFALVAINADAVNGGNPIAPTLTSSLDINDPQHVILSWTPAANIMNLRYEVWRGTNLGNMARIVPEAFGLGWNEYNMPLDTTFIYRVVAIGNGGVNAPSNNTAATPISWWPDTQLSSGLTPVRAQHWTDLRRGVDYVRTAAGLPTNSWASAISSSTVIQAAHLIELRAKLVEANTALVVGAPVFTTPAPTAGISVIRVQDVLDLRKAIE